MPLSCLCRAWLSFVLLALPAPVLPAADPPPDKKQVTEWIKDLGARQFTRRDRAQQKLWEAGGAAEEALRDAAKSTDAEVQRRAKEILAKFKWGIYPSTPKKVVEMIEKYQSAEQHAKQLLVRDLFEQGGAGLAALLKIADAEENEGARRLLYQAISREAGRAIPLLAAEKNVEMLEKLFELTIESDREQTLPHYIAFHYLQGNLERRIVHFQKLAAGNVNTDKANEVLFYLYRARGEMNAARTAAEKARRLDLVVGLLEEQGKWEELAGKDFAMEDRQPPERLGYRAAYLRLAGKEKEFAEAIAACKKAAEAHEADGVDRWNVVKSLFLNDSPEVALALMGAGWSAQKKLDVLVAQMRFKEALELAGNPPDAQSRDAFEVVRARTLHFLGKKDEAGKLFAALAEKIKPGNDYSWYENFLEAEVRSGLKELAYEHCARALLCNSSPYSQVRLLKKVFNGEEETAQVWWMVLRRKQASEDATVSMKGLRKLLAGEIKGKELLQLVGEVEAAAREPMTLLGPGQVHRWLQSAGEVALKAGDEVLAKTCFDKAADQGKAPAPLIRWGDHLAKQKKWKEAAEAYASAAEKDRRQPLALYLRGDALVQAGAKKDGETLMDQAHWLPLGDEQLRMDFARDLAVRGQHAASKKARAMLLKTCVPGSFQAGEARRLDGIDAMKEHKYLEAAQLHEQAMLRCHRVFISFLEAQAYVSVPHYIHRLRARGLTLAGKYDEAKKNLAVCETALPGNIDLAIHLVPALEKQGKKKEADELYRRQREVQRKLLEGYPASAGLCNSLAWLGASCRRDLEEAQKHAEKAVELEPTLPGYRDTLAEVLFQRGKKGEAIAQMKKCLALEQHREYYKRQLQRFEAGDPKADVPLDE